MITRMGMARKADALTLREFQAHWAGSHAEATLALPGLRGYLQLPSVLGDDGEALLAELGYESIGQLDFDSVPAMDDAFASEAYATTVAGDEAQFIDKTRFEYGVFDRTVVVAGAAPLALVAAWPGRALEIRHHGPHERYVAVHDRPSPFRRVDLLGVDDVEAGLALARRLPGAKRLLTRPIAVLGRG